MDRGSLDKKFSFKKKIGEEDEETRKQRTVLRTNLLFFSVFVLFALIITRLAVLQFIQSEELKGQQQSINTKNVPLTPSRGTIYDSTGKVRLAYSTPMQSLYVTLPKDYSKRTEKDRKPADKLLPELNAFADKLASKLNELGHSEGERLDAKEIIQRLDPDYIQYRGFTPRLVKSDLSQKEIAYFLEHRTEFPGVEVIEESVRHYDPDRVAVQTIGYMYKFKGARANRPKYKELYEANSEVLRPEEVYSESETVGYDGLELQYQDELRGKNGYKTVEVNPRSMPEGIRSITPPAKGHHLYSTINKEIQQKTEQAIMDQLRWLRTHAVSGKLHPDATTGFAVAMEVETGHIVAMASMPDYDSNVWKTGSASPSVYDDIQHKMGNGTIKSVPSGKVGPHPESSVLLGSTIKPLTVLIGLKENLFSPGQTYQDTGSAYYGKNRSSRVGNSGGHVYGSLTPSRAIEVSSNTFMVDMIGKPLYAKYGSNAGMHQGIDVWDKYMKQFGLGVPTEVDLPGEWAGRLEYTSKHESALTRLVQASFGQQGKYTAMQLAQYTTVLATKGKRMQPHLVSKIVDDQGNLVREFKPKVLNEVAFSDTYWNTVIRGMATDVKAFNGFPYDYARKTGTSQQVVGRTVKDNGVFIAFAPRQNPKLAVAVIIPEGGFGATSAGPVARKIFDAYDEVYGLDGIPKKPLAAN
ncbi:peptidoglycan D,D-transpeptidase FtsI family protein [Paenibacillus polymyxa]|uniref:peptidoglycan D,D-transpeptidase FtsI family protein n=1 Tax=Paenibacillus polymyxa TaxID=1406 RepID=UPI0025B63CB4|nr:penicillin-binding transpeptidase domain-containing protein [Paenibacillus polymyxa]MDN4089910.1 penicillin-binding transpeptidase domain-containing protein [Paenibacillus polymyxa]